MMRGFFSIAFIFIMNVPVFAQLSKVHYLPPVAYSSETGSNAIPTNGQYFYISTPSTTSVTVNIYAIGGATTTMEVSNAFPSIFAIDEPGGFDESQIAIGASSSDAATTTSIISNNKGYIVEADSAIYVALRMANTSQAGALVSKGGAALGTNFRIGAFTNYNSTSNYSSFLSVMATENATTISINDILEGTDILDFDEQALGTDGTGYLNTINITLNRGESYTIVTRSDQGTDVLSNLEAASTQLTNSDGLIGTYVGSSKPVVVNCGSLNGSFGLGGARDFGFDQIVDFSKVGTEYVFVRGTGNDEWENVLLVAHTDNTEITINGSPISNALIHRKGVNVSNTYTPTLGNLSINAGDYFLIEGDLYGPDGNMYVQSSSPIFAYQGIGFGGSEANQGLFFVPPLKCSSVGDVDNIPQINNIGNAVYDGNLNIISKRGATITISDDNNTNQAIETLNIANLSGPFDIIGNVNYQTYVLSNLNGNVSIVSNDELYCSYFNQNGAASSGAFYSGFSSPPEVPTEIIGPELYDYCAPNVMLTTANMDLFTSYEWQYSDGTGYITVAESTDQSTITPTLGGLYLVRGFISCPGETEEFLDSDPITVILCPPDTDLDGILDPVDSCPFAAGISFLNGCPWSIYIGNNYKSILTSSTLEVADESYFCSQTNDNHFNLAYHSGELAEPAVGDFIIYNNSYSFPHSFLFETEGYAYMKLRDFNKILEVKKSNGEIVAIYNCL